MRNILFTCLYMRIRDKKLRNYKCHLINCALIFKDAPIAQLDRVSDFESEGCGFKSYLACQTNKIVSRV